MVMVIMVVMILVKTMIVDDRNDGKHKYGDVDDGWDDYNDGS